MAISAKAVSVAEKNDIPVESGDMQLLGKLFRITRLQPQSYTHAHKTATLILILPATLGYKQELRRHYSTTQVFAVAFSIMGLLPSIASTLSFSIPAGPVGMVWVNR